MTQQPTPLDSAPLESAPLESAARDSVPVESASSESTSVGTALCRLDEIPDGGAIAVPLDPMTQCIVLRRGGEAWAYVNRCPHFSIPLDFEPGEFCTYDATHLMCAHHSAMFRFEDGQCVDGPCEGAALTKIDVLVRDGRVLRERSDTA